VDSPNVSESGRAKYGLGSFLFVVVLVRLSHFALMPTLLYGMVFREVLGAKRVLDWGLGEALLPSAPFVAGLLAGVSKLTGRTPLEILPIVLLVIHVLMAHAFWLWTNQVVQDRFGWTRFSALLLFVFFPGLNSYEGIRNPAALLAASCALYILVGVREDSSERGPKQRLRWNLALGAVVMMLCRTEYIVLLPAYFGMTFLASRWSSGRARVGVSYRSWAPVVVGMACGMLLTMAVRKIDANEFSTARAGYTTYTFLDGSPARWLSPSDDSELERIARGVEHFGEPEKYDYSLFRMILANPLVTGEKCALNIPRWIFELGWRHVVFPVPFFALFILGCIGMVCGRAHHDAKHEHVVDWVAVWSALGMTIPLVGMMLYAEYMAIAFSSLCVGTAFGLELILRLAKIRGSQLLFARAILLGLTIVGLEGLSFRAGGGLPNQDPYPAALVHGLSDELSGEHSMKVIVDPADHVIECALPFPVANQWVRNRIWMEDYGRIPPHRNFQAKEPMISLIESHPELLPQIDGVLLPIKDDRADDRNAAEGREALALAWEKLGFRHVRYQGHGFALLVRDP
jgi:hypothetical protein